MIAALQSYDAGQKVLQTLDQTMQRSADHGRVDQWLTRLKFPRSPPITGQTRRSSTGWTARCGGRAPRT